jgi:hypothetical protein
VLLRAEFFKPKMQNVLVRHGAARLAKDEGG